MDTKNPTTRCEMCGLYAEANANLMKGMNMLLELNMLQERARADDETLTQEDVDRNKYLSSQFPLQVAECKRLVQTFNALERQPAILMVRPALIS